MHSHTPPSHLVAVGIAAEQSRDELQRLLAHHAGLVLQAVGNEPNELAQALERNGLFLGQSRPNL